MKGKLLIIGGAEDKGEKDPKKGFSDEIILRRFICESRLKEKSRIEIVTSASEIPEKMGEVYVKAFGKIGATNTGVMIIESREEAELKKNLDRLQKADAVFFTGGTQLRLTSIFGGTEFYNLLLKKLEDPHFIYAGTSAGAAAASESMMKDGSSDEAADKGEVSTTTGFGLVKNIIFDTHFIARGRIGRLFEIVVSNPTVLGVGLEENTALLIYRNKMEAVGPGMAILLDGRSITESNLLDVIKGAPLSFSNMTMHLMSQTDVFNLTTMKLKILNPPEEEQTD
ncbi:cyanophycinase [Chryseobacterium sp.]|uniref:cyanophycinase n=1 Tax=Chryseobacterium sp. TaxID=1871047 RepID=UPI0011CCAF13|nr:cyanophycinase [Chryseobacterium sp.]TXF79473.1 cyanophycinase [Chryseobacterium sp.]